MSTDQHQAAERNYEFTVGEFDCTVVSDGSFAYPNPSRLFFFNAEQDELATALEWYGIEPESWKTYVSPYPCLLIQTDDSTVLVDTGGGTLGDHTGKLSTNLQQVGTPPETIDKVLRRTFIRTTSVAISTRTVIRRSRTRSTSSPGPKLSSG